MRMHTDAARLMVWNASWRGASGVGFEAAEGSQSKLFAGETAVRVTDEAIQILSGAGYIRDHPVERWHRDAKVFTIFEGTSEIQRLLIARAISGLRLS
jgi:acyl-CoA dehydrogenase